jgi:AcrR family transcriptional regulator
LGKNQSVLDKVTLKVTVEEICRRSNISKRTFYNHFDSKYAILSWFLEIAKLSITKEIGRSLWLLDGLLKTHNFIYGEKEFVCYAAGYMQSLYDNRDYGARVERPAAARLNSRDA